LCYPCGALQAFVGSLSASPDASTPEAFVRQFLQATAERNLSALEQMVAKDADVIGYTIGGRKHIGWREFSLVLKEEFDSTTSLELPIMELHVWSRGDTAWYAAELDYIRHVGQGSNGAEGIIPLRQTGVLERRSGRWVLVSIHESLRRPAPLPFPHAVRTEVSQRAGQASASTRTDLSGQWEIQEEDKTYVATLDAAGSGSYTWQGGRIVTTRISDLRWEGTWHQPGNDREGGFEVGLAEDATEAQGVWWYTRVGDRTNIPPRQWGGSYSFKRLSQTPGPNSRQTP